MGIVPPYYGTVKATTVGILQTGNFRKRLLFSKFQNIFINKICNQKSLSISK